MTPYNMRRIIGYLGLSLVFLLLIVGCSIWPSVFDTNEHARIVNIYVASLDDSICNRRETAAPVARQMFQDARWTWHYGLSLPDNEPMTKMEFEILQMIRELHERYERPEAVSVFYCKNKLENIRRATDAMIKASARRPRS